MGGPLFLFFFFDQVNSSFLLSAVPFFLFPQECSVNDKAFRFFPSSSIGPAAGFSFLPRVGLIIVVFFFPPAAKGGVLVFFSLFPSEESLGTTLFRGAPCPVLPEWLNLFLPFSRFQRSSARFLFFSLFFSLAGLSRFFFLF